MTFNITVTTDHVNTILAGLNKLEHGQARGTFDHVLHQVQQQEVAAKAMPAQEDTQPAGLGA